MKLPIIKIKDNCTKKEFVVTDCDSHDYLYADNKGIHYYNLQNGEGTGGYEDSGYSFVGETGYMGTDIPMVGMEDILTLYYEIKIKPLNSEKLSLDFDLLMGSFKTLDMRVENALKKRRQELHNIMMEYAQKYLDD